MVQNQGFLKNASEELWVIKLFLYGYTISFTSSLQNFSLQLLCLVEMYGFVMRVQT